MSYRRVAYPIWSTSRFCSSADLRLYARDGARALRVPRNAGPRRTPAIDIPQASPEVSLAGGPASLALWLRCSYRSSVLLLTTVYPVLAVGGVYYRITEPSQREEPADAKPSGTPRPTAQI